jgi:hypothetical protein
MGMTKKVCRISAMVAAALVITLVIGYKGNIMSHNGWSNYETWRVNLEMVDGMRLEDFVEFHDNDSVFDADQAQYLADLIRDYCEDVIEQQSSDFARDLALSFLQKVDWREIADHLIMEPSV